MSLVRKIRCYARWICKEGGPIDEYEDAFCWDVEKSRFAIADGATESGFAALWAKMLVNRYVDQALILDNSEVWLEGVRSSWLAEVSQLSLPWYAEMKREEGAFSTFLGVEISESSGSQDLQWIATAVGDSCLLHFRDNGLLTAFPMSSASQFDNSPSLISSRSSNLAPGFPLFERRTGELRVGDSMILATDALAKWCLKQTEDGQSLLHDLRRFDQVEDDELIAAAFDEWVQEQRRLGIMRNDDVTMMAITIEAESSS